MSRVLRPAEPTDIDDVLELWRESAENRGRPTDTRTAVETLLDRADTALILAVEAATGWKGASTLVGPIGSSIGSSIGGSASRSAVVGTIIVGWDGWRCHLYRLAVRPDRRRQGIGRELVAAAERRARELGATRIDAMVLAENALGQAIWQCTGFEQQADWRRWVKPIA